MAQHATTRGPQVLVLGSDTRATSFGVTLLLSHGQRSFLQVDTWRNPGPGRLLMRLKLCLQLHKALKERFFLPNPKKSRDRIESPALVYVSKTTLYVLFSWEKHPRCLDRNSMCVLPSHPPDLPESPQSCVPWYVLSIFRVGVGGGATNQD